MRASVLPLAVLALQGCALEPAPESLDEVFLQLWRGFPDATDRELDRIADAALALPELAQLDGALRGTQGRLGDDDVRVVAFFDDDGQPLPAPDPSLARPLYLVEHLDCSLEAYERIMLHAAQDELYEGVYEHYARTWVEDPEPFREGEVDRLGWEGTLTTRVSVLGEYVYPFRTEARRVPALDAPVHGDAWLLVRNWMPRPATWTRGNGSFPQDYQLEAFLPLDDDTLLHLYPVWRELVVAGSSIEADVVADINLDQMAKWGRTTATLCAEGRP